MTSPKRLTIETTQKSPGAPPTQHKIGPSHGLLPVSIFEVPAIGTRVWNPESVRTAVLETAQGRMQNAGDLARTMETDEAYSAAMQRRVNGLIKSPYRIVPKNPDDDDCVRAAMLTENFIDKMLPYLELRRLVTWLHQLDVGVATLDWTIDQDADTWIPTLRCLNPRWIWYDISRNVWVHTSYEGIRDINPGDGRWVFGVDWMYGKPSGMVSALSEVWISKRYAFRDWNQWSDFYAWPFVKAKYPSGGSETPEEKEAFVNDVASMYRTKVIGVATGDDTNTYDVDTVVMSSGDAWHGFKERIEYVDRKYQIKWLGGNLSSEINQVGSFAASRTHDGVEKELLEGDAKVLADIISTQIIKPFIIANGGREEHLPTITWTIFDEEDAQSKASSIASFAKALTDFKTAGYEVDNIKQAAEAFGLVLKKHATVAATPDAPEADVEETTHIALTSTDIASIITVDEARASQGLGPLMTNGVRDPDGSLTVTEYKAKHSAIVATAADAEAGTGGKKDDGFK